MMETTHTKWVFDQNSDDIRGWPVLDDNGNRLGTVMELLADADSGYVSEIVLADGQRFLAHDLEIGDKVLHLQRARVAATPIAAAATTAARPAVATKLAEPTAPPKLEIVPKAPAVTKPAIVEPPAPQAVRTIGDDVVVQLIDEELDVGKRRFGAGGVHLETHLVTEPISDSVRLHEEHVTVKRNKVDRALDASEATRLFQDDTFEVRTKAELPVVCKSAHVIEEIVIKKNALDRVETVRDTVRHMDAEIIELRANNGEGAKL